MCRAKTSHMFSHRQGRPEDPCTGVYAGQPGYGVFRCSHRFARIFTTFEGTSEIQRMIIGRAVTGLDVR